MEKYRLDENTKADIEDSVVPIGVYQAVDGHVVTLAVSDGLCELFGYKSRVRPSSESSTPSLEENLGFPSSASTALK